MLYWVIWASFLIATEYVFIVVIGHDFKKSKFKKNCKNYIFKKIRFVKNVKILNFQPWASTKIFTQKELSEKCQ